MNHEDEKRSNNEDRHSMECLSVAFFYAVAVVVIAFHFWSMPIYWSIPK